MAWAEQRAGEWFGLAASPGMNALKLPRAEALRPSEPDSRGERLSASRNRSLKKAAMTKARAQPRAQPMLGLREQNKRDKMQRIRRAAGESFARHGYGSATMRRIAQRAHVGLGTLFNYAESKQDLVFLIFNDELAALTDKALATARSGTSLIDQLMAIFRCHYRHFGSKPELARILLQELTFYSTGKQAATFLQTRRRLIEGIEQRVLAAQRAHTILSKVNSKFIARHLFFTYSAAIRWWIGNPHPEAEVGLADLRRLLQLQVTGLSPSGKAKRAVKR